jgi:oxygen-independent coproporphyrinogen-3 oxidase
MLPIEQMAQVLEAAATVVPFAGAEITVECNPGTVLGRDYLRDLRSLGVNRISMGVQSLSDPMLRMLGRIHSAAEARASYDDARRVGFDSVNLDFIFGLPGQTTTDWRETSARSSDVGCRSFRHLLTHPRRKHPLVRPSDGRALERARR